MEMDSQKAFRIFLLTGLPQAFSYSQAVKRREERNGEKPRRQ